jgi:hypothetical protein
VPKQGTFAGTDLARLFGRSRACLERPKFWSKASAKRVKGSVSQTKTVGLLKGRRCRVNLEMSFTVELTPGCCVRPVRFYRPYHLRRGSCRGRRRRRMHRFMGHAQLRRALGTDWRSLCQASPRACERHGTRSSRGSRTPMGAALPPADRARSLWRSPISLRRAGVRVRRLLASRVRLVHGARRPGRRLVRRS